MHHEPQRQDEAWWERELLRNQKLMDKYQAVFDSETDWTKFQTPEDLHNKIYFNIDPPEKDESSPEEKEAEEIELWTEGADLDEADEEENESLLEIYEKVVEEGDDFDDLGYDEIKEQARAFGVRTLKLRDLPEDMEVIRLSGAKVGANLAGGHGLGYRLETICGNIVKCKWALADCEFCREILGYLYKAEGKKEFLEMQEQSLQLSNSIRARIQNLRARSPWS